MKLLTAIKNYFEKIETEKLYEELANRKHDLRRENIIKTLNTMANYLVSDMFCETGLLYRADDPYIKSEVQRLFWEWKREGIINEFDNFNDETWAWLQEYAI